MTDTFEFKAEGAKNAVFRHLSSKRSGRVLRVRKRKRGSSVSNHLAREIELYNQTIRPLLSPRYCPPVHLRELTPTHLRALQEVLDASAPRRVTRFLQTEIDPNTHAAFEMIDHTADPSHGQSDTNTFTIEIKPKSGRKQRLGDRELCYFCLRQLLKIENCEEKQISHYCASDFFSGDKRRMGRSIEALIKTPQNNFKFFYQGQLYYSGRSGGAHKHMPLEDVASLDRFVSEHVFRMNNTQPGVDSLIDVILCIFQQESDMLRRISALQHRDYFGIDRIQQVYHALLSLGLQDDLERFCTLSAPSDLHPLTVAEQQEFLRQATSDGFLEGTFQNEQIGLCFRVIKDFLFAASFKDCSIMLTLAPFSMDESGAPVDCPPCWQLLPSFKMMYRASVIDVDIKSTRNIPKYSQLYHTLHRVAFQQSSGDSNPSIQCGAT